jgi:hypothetical protein
MNSRVMARIIKELQILESKEKSTQEAEIALAIQRDLEKEKETKEERRARELRWIISGEGFI